MKGLKIILAMAVVCGLAANSQAADKKWSDQAELSFVDTGGNSETTTLSAKNELKYKFSDKFDGTWKIGALTGESGGTKTAESYFTELRLDYSYTERMYSYVNGGWSKDKFANIDSRYFIGPGIGYRFLLGPKHFLAGELGVSYFNEEYIAYTVDSSNDYMAGRLFGKYEFAFNDTNKFTQTLEYLHDFDESENYNIITETALTSALSTNYSLKVSYTMKYDHLVIPATLDDTDTILAVALVANF